MKFIFFLMLVCILSACGTPVLRENNVELAAVPYDDNRSERDVWQVEGKIAVKYDSKGLTFRFVWRQKGNQTMLSFSAPLGVVFRFFITDDYCEYINEKGEVFRATSSEELMLNEIGWFVPIKRAMFWIKGIPFPDAKIEAVSLYQDNNYKQFTQLPWTVTVEEYFTDRRLPKAIVFLSDGVRIKVAIKKWNFRYD